MASYSWLTYRQARQALAARLADTANLFWLDDELGVYLKEALRTYNALTEVWIKNFAFTATSESIWYDLSALDNSPRLRTVLDTDLYVSLEYSLLEPATGGTWTGTSQFNISDLSGALQRRRDEIIQETGCNVKQLDPIKTTPNVRRTSFADNVLEPRRARFVPDSGSAVTLSREDTIAFDSFETGHLQTSRTPAAWSVITGPPLSMDVDTAPNVSSTYDVLALESGLPFAPPAGTLLGIPDDWSWLTKWGALADLLGRESEATDRQRADYCLKKYSDGIKAMKASNWLVSATVNGLVVDTPSVKEMDGFSPEWQDNALAWPSLVQAGMDFVAPCPAAVTIIGVSTNVIQNAPLPTADDDKVQVSRDTFDAILDYAQTLACFKMGGSEFASCKDLEANFMRAVMDTNKRLAKMGLFADMIKQEGKRQDIAQPR